MNVSLSYPHWLVRMDLLFLNFSLRPWTEAKVIKVIGGHEKSDIKYWFMETNEEEVEETTRKTGQLIML